MKYYTTDEIAKGLKVKVETIRRWIRNGKLSAVNIGGKGNTVEYRISEAALNSFIAERSNVKEH